MKIRDYYTGMANTLELWTAGAAGQSTLCYVVARPLCTVGYTSVGVLSTVDSGITNLIHDHCSCSVFTLSSVGTSRLDVSTQA